MFFFDLKVFQKLLLIDQYKVELFHKNVAKIFHYNITFNIPINISIIHQLSICIILQKYSNGELHDLTDTNKTEYSTHIPGTFYVHIGNI